MHIQGARVASVYQNLSFRGWLGLLAILTFIASCVSMAVIYQNPFAHIKVCLGGAPMAENGALLLYGHCAWCYLAVGFGLAALIAPPKNNV